MPTYQHTQWGTVLLAIFAKEAHDRWWVGLYILASPDTTEHMGDSIWGEAAASFGEAVALELKAKVFGPFASIDHIGLPMDSEGRVARQYVGWRRALRGQGMLGDMIECLLQARHPNHEAARALKVWLSEQQPGLARYLESRSNRLKDLPRLRGDAQHSSIQESDARKVSAFLEALLGSPA